jgi:hypothetical protein
LAIAEKDYKKLSAIVKSPDLAIIGATRRNKVFNAYAKRMDWETFLYFDEVMDSKHNKALRGSTFYKIKKTTGYGRLFKNCSHERKIGRVWGKKTASVAISPCHALYAFGQYRRNRWLSGNHIG